MLIKDREIVKWIMQKSKKMHNGDQYYFYTMKEDRGMILKRENHQFIIEEFGYQNQIFLISDDK